MYPPTRLIVDERTWPRDIKYGNRCMHFKVQCIYNLHNRGDGRESRSLHKKNLTITRCIRNTVAEYHMIDWWDRPVLMANERRASKWQIPRPQNLTLAKRTDSSYELSEMYLLKCIYDIAICDCTMYTIIQGQNRYIILCWIWMNANYSKKMQTMTNLNPKRSKPNKKAKKKKKTAETCTRLDIKNRCRNTI